MLVLGRSLRRWSLLQDSDHHFASNVPLTDVAESLGCLAQSVGSVDDRLHFAALNKAPQKDHVLAGRYGEKGPTLLTQEGGSHKRLHDVTHAGTAAVGYVNAAWSERASALGERTVRHVVEDEVVALPASREVLSGVFDDVVRAERSDHLHVPRAANTGDVRSEDLGDLHRKGPHAARGTVDQDPLPRLHLSRVTKTVEGREGGRRYGRRSLEREVGRLERETALPPARVFRASAVARSEHLVTREPRLMRLATPGTENVPQVVIRAVITP